MLAYTMYAIFASISIPEGQEFVVERGESVSQISKKLKERGYVRNSELFSLYAFITGSSKKLQAGLYGFSGEVTADGIIKKLREGNVVATDKKITIIEGWDIDDIADHLKKEGFIKNRHKFLSIVYESSLWDQVFDDDTMFLKQEIGDRSLEGFLFPDTYRIALNAPPEEIISLMTENFANKAFPVFSESGNQGRTLRQIIIMASLLEKEVQTKEDMELVSGILWKRIQAVYPLQIDATITYLTGKESKEISGEDLDIDSFYNTYKYQGLPPGPIANPGLQAIEAALHPTRSSFWFYLTANDGTTIFSNNFSEHRLAKRKYLK